jgi:hypothetical protein
MTVPVFKCVLIFKKDSEIGIYNAGYMLISCLNIKQCIVIVQCTIVGHFGAGGADVGAPPPKVLYSTT